MTTLWVTGNPASQTFNHANCYFGITCGFGWQNQVSTAGEAQAQQAIQSAGIFSGLTIYISSNTDSLSSTVNFRVSGGNGNQTISYVAGATGLFQDASHSDTITAGALCDLQITPGTSSGSKGTGSSVLFTPTSGDYVMYACNYPFAVTSTSTYFDVIGGATGNSVIAEATTQTEFFQSGTLQNATVNVSVNSKTTAQTFVCRINGANGNQSVSVTASTTGVFTDSSHTDGVTSGTLACMSFVSSGGGSITQTRGVGFVPGSGNYVLENAVNWNISNIAPSTTQFARIGGFANTSAVTTSPPSQVPVGFAAQSGSLSAFVDANAASATCTVQTYKNSSAGNGSLSISGGATGSFTDTTNIDNFGSTDLLCISATNSDATNTVGFYRWGLQLRPAPTVMGNGNLNLGFAPW